MGLNPKILSPLEEQQVKAFLKEDGEKNMSLRVLITRVRKNLPEIKRELELLERFVRAYQKAK